MKRLTFLAVSLFAGVFCVAPSDAATTAVQVRNALDDQTGKQIERLIVDDASILNQTFAENGGQTPLMSAVLGGNVEAVRVLLKAGADPNIGEKDGYTAVHGAGFQGRAEILKVLMEEGKNVDPFHFHRDGYNGMHRACWGSSDRHAETIKMFIKYNVTPDIPAKNGQRCSPRHPKSRQVIKEWLKTVSKTSKSTAAGTGGAARDEM
eukprot:GDKI01023650.1.p1 GENE.GDKI01023650.1~~GDKI01023650.1.p1  ORF type:complete len:207 (+),score=63.53 GDKI01023650.1:73-693(+)